MKILAGALALAFLPALAPAALAQDKPTWAFPVTDKEQPDVKPNTAPRSAPGSARQYTRAQADNMFEIPDWYPEMYPKLPKVVANGNAPNVRACGSCHLPVGTGHDESAYVAALPAAYFIRQMQDYRSGARKGSGSMALIGQHITDAEIKEAADYFASLKPMKWHRVVETDTVPKTYIAQGNKRLLHPAGGTEPIGNRIITVRDLDNASLASKQPTIRNRGVISGSFPACPLIRKPSKTCRRCGTARATSTRTTPWAGRLIAKSITSSGRGTRRKLAFANRRRLMRPACP